MIDDEVDRDRCVKSVLDARRRIARLCDELNITRQVEPVLRDMEMDYISHLDYVEDLPENYAVPLVRLRDRLHEGEKRLTEHLPDLAVTRPGARRDWTPDWLASSSS